MQNSTSNKEPESANPQSSRQNALTNGTLHEERGIEATRLQELAAEATAGDRTGQDCRTGEACEVDVREKPKKPDGDEDTTARSRSWDVTYKDGDVDPGTARKSTLGSRGMSFTRTVMY